MLARGGSRMLWKLLRGAGSTLTINDIVNRHNVSYVFHWQHFRVVTGCFSRL